MAVDIQHMLDRLKAHGTSRADALDQVNAVAAKRLRTLHEPGRSAAARGLIQSKGNSTTTTAASPPK